MRDFQQSKVYQWENQFPDGGRVEFGHTQALVNHIWEQEGLKYPPKVEPIHHLTTRWAGKANRMNIYLPQYSTTKTIIHELAHSMTNNFHDEGDPNRRDQDHGHDAEFMGVYLKLLHKYMCIDLFRLIDTAGRAGIKFNINARPVFLD